jgi:NRPS condensation-like uncharacterized protein
VDIKERELLKKKILLKQLLLKNEKLEQSDDVSIPEANRTQLLPLSWSQQRLWFIAQFDVEASRAYHMPTQLPMQGDLNIDALQATLDALLERHEVLRTTFTNIDGEPYQVIHPTAHFALHHVDLSDFEGETQQAALRSEQEAEADASFDLSTGPLIRARLIQRSQPAQQQASYVLCITMHHIVSDGWSEAIFIREINTLYEALCDGQPSPLAPLTIQYADYAAWQRSAVVEETITNQLNYWQTQLRGAPELLTLPLDYPRPAAQDYAGGDIRFTLNAEHSARLRELARMQGMTLNMLMLAVWGLLLSRLSGQDTVVIGAPVANRPRAELEELIGFFVNTLAIRIDVDESLSVSDFFAQVKKQALGAYGHQDVPLSK